MRWCDDGLPSWTIITTESRARARTRFTNWDLLKLQYIETRWKHQYVGGSREKYERKRKGEREEIWRGQTFILLTQSFSQHSTKLLDCRKPKVFLHFPCSVSGGWSVNVGRKEFAGSAGPTQSRRVLSREAAASGSGAANTPGLATIHRTAAEAGTALQPHHPYLLIGRMTAAGFCRR